MNQKNAAIEWLWPSILDFDTATKASRQGFYAAMFVAATNAAMSLAGHLGYFSRLEADFTGIFDAAIFAAIAFGIWKYSRVAAVVGLSLYLLSCAYVILNFNHKVGALTIFITLAFINGIRGAFLRKKMLQTKSRA